MKKKPWSNTIKKIVAIYVLLNVVLVMISVGRVQEEKQNNYERALADAERNGLRIQSTLQNAVNIAELSGREIKNIYAHNIIEDDILSVLKDYHEVNVDVINTVAYCPEGYAAYIYPDNEQLHINVFEENECFEDALYGAKYGCVTISGPYELMAGTQSFVILYPVYDSSQTREEAHFLGFTMVMIDLDMIIHNTGIFTLSERNYDYHITKQENINDIAENVKVIASSGDFHLNDAAKYSFELEDYEFVILVKPKTGWVDSRGNILQFFAAEVILILLAALTYAFSQVRKQAAILKEISETDALTQLWNRAAIPEHAQKCIGKKTTVIMMDIDYFKTFNDNYGHEMGDRVLQEVASVMKQNLLATSMAFRFGGDEFLLWDIYGDETYVQSSVNRIVQKIEQIHIEGCNTSIHMSYGLISGQVHCLEDLEQLKLSADERLYEVKKKR